MAYEAEKDKEIRSWKHEGGLYVTLYQYNGGEPKIQIGPREYKKSDGSPGYGKAGRLTLAEMGWLFSLKDEIRGEVQKLKGK
uniref:Uncharacterized protein n=1 Tax=Desulfobacca acetoxidans TaxID=60893 RepID=A0A7C3V6B5_9BACT